MDLNNIDQSNPEELFKAFAAMEGGAEPVADTSQQTTQQAIEQPKQPEGEAEGNTGATESAEENAEGVASKSGKNIIPYSVLEQERRRGIEARERLAAAEAQIEALTKQAKEGVNLGETTRPGQPEAKEQGAGDLSDEDMASLAEDFPTVHKTLVAAMAKLKQMEAQLSPVAETVQGQMQAKARSEAEQVQAVIDELPKLAHLQSSDAEGFAIAQQFDALLRGQPAWQDKPLSERFAKVVEMVEATRGAINVKPTSLTKEDLAKAAQAKAAQSAAPRVPTSLSEFPAGNPAASDEKEALGQLSPTQLAAKFAAMSPDQMDEYLSNL